MTAAAGVRESLWPKLAAELVTVRTIGRTQAALHVAGQAVIFVGEVDQVNSIAGVVRSAIAKDLHDRFEPALATLRHVESLCKTYREAGDTGGAIAWREGLHSIEAAVAQALAKAGAR